MLMPLSKAAMAKESYSSDQLPFLLLFNVFLTPSCPRGACDTGTRVLAKSLKPAPIPSEGGGFYL
jgi:hypothetical protein